MHVLRHCCETAACHNVRDRIVVVQRTKRKRCEGNARSGPKHRSTYGLCFVTVATPHIPKVGTEPEADEPIRILSTPRARVTIPVPSELTSNSGMPWILANKNINEPSSRSPFLEGTIDKSIHYDLHNSALLGRKGKGLSYKPALPSHQYI